MIYRKKIAALAGIAAALAVVYILTFILDPQRVGSRSDIYSWLDLRQKDRIDRISIAGTFENIALVKKDGKWVVFHEGKDYPARQLRVDDFIMALARPAPYPVRSSSASSHERVSLTEESSIRVTVSSGESDTLLDLLIGQGDITGHEIYLRKQGQNEVRSGEDIFSAYIRSSQNTWYNLRLFPETEDGQLDVASVQRLTVYPLEEESGETPPPMIFTRNGRVWSFNFDLANPDMGNVDNYIRDMLYTMGDHFADAVELSDPMFTTRMVLEFGDGSIRTIRLSPQEEDGRCLATITGSNMVYALPPWASVRLFAEPELFERP